MRLSISESSLPAFFEEFKVSEINIKCEREAMQKKHVQDQRPSFSIPKLVSLSLFATVQLPFEQKH